MHEHLFKHFNSMIYNGFLHNDSITLIDKTDGQNPKKRDEYWRRTSKPTRPLDLMLKTVSDQPHIAKNVAYGLPFYGPVWILVWQGPFLDQEFGHDFLGLFGNTFRQGFVSCGSISYQLFVFYMVQVSLERCFRICFSFCDFFTFVDYGFLGASRESSVLVELHVDGMQFYQQ